MSNFVVLLLLGLSLLTYCSATDVVLANVMQEHFIAKTYIKAILHMQSGMYGGKAGQLFALASLHTAKKGATKEEGLQANRLALEGVITSYVDMKTLRYSTIIGAEDAQMDFYTDRIAQLQIQSLGSQVPSQLYFLIYMKFYLSYLKTMKFALTFQFLGHVSSLYEDWSDGGMHSVQHNQPIRNLEYEDMIVDKLHTFSTLQSLKQTELIVFYLQWYMNYITAALSGQQAFSGQTNLWSQMLSLYSLLYIYSGAQSALHSTTLEYNSHLIKGSQPDKSEDYRVVANHLFAAFGQAYSMSSQINYINAIFSIYSVFVAFMYQAYAQYPVQPAATNTTPAATTTTAPKQ